MENIVEINGLTKKYDDFTLDNINLNIKKGSIMGLIGANGAGKTTIIKLMLNSVHKDSGDIKIFGMDSFESEKDIKQDLGVILDGCFFFFLIRLNEIPFVMKNTYKNWDTDLYFNYLKRFNLNPKKRIRDLSTGMKMKLKIAIILSHNPKLLVLDECTNGLDPVMRNEMLDIFSEFVDEEKSIIFSTHITSDLERIADQITFISDGKIIISDDKDNLLNNYQIVKCGKDELGRFNKEDILRVKENKDNFEVLLKNGGNGNSRLTLEDIMIVYERGVSLEGINL
ncbi:MAG: ABC transporter ATP-binding protein [Clostridia bacterium]|nr:ABC transporter ATP-binding protein [Clostridia bacterium]